MPCCPEPKDRKDVCKRYAILCAAPPLFIGWVVLVLADWKIAVVVGLSLAVVLIAIKATMNHFEKKEMERKREEEKVQRAKALQDATREREADLAAAMAMGKKVSFVPLVLSVGFVACLSLSTQ